MKLSFVSRRNRFIIIGDKNANMSAWLISLSVLW